MLYLQKTKFYVNYPGAMYLNDLLFPETASLHCIIMGRARQTKRFATMKRMISASDPRLKDKDRAPAKKKKPEDPNEVKTTEHVQQSSALFFQYNTQLGPPFHILVDTNFINFSIKNKMDIIQSMMDCLYAKCIPYITGVLG